MGLFDFIRGELIEVIDWVESGKDTVLWKFPHKGNNIKYKAKLTVRESQTVLFFNEGQFADLFEPGMYELNTENLPVLTSLKNWETGFKSPFLCDVYFLSSRVFTNLKWGTPNPIIMRDPQFKQVSVKAFGTYFIKVVNPIKFFTQFAGTNMRVSTFDVENAMRDLVTPKFAEALTEAKVSVLDMVSNYTEIGDKVKPLIQKDFEDFGIEITNFNISSTSLPAAVQEFYDKMTTIHMVDDVSKFQQITNTQTIEKAVENEKGSASEGIGLGIGFGMANQIMQEQQKQTMNVNSRQEIMETLKELGALKETGILTQEEFDAKKKELLSRL